MEEHRQTLGAGGGAITIIRTAFVAARYLRRFHSVRNHVRIVLKNNGDPWRDSNLVKDRAEKAGEIRRAATTLDELANDRTYPTLADLRLAPPASTIEAAARHLLALSDVVRSTRLDDQVGSSDEGIRMAFYINEVDRLLRLGLQWGWEPRPPTLADELARRLRQHQSSARA